MSDRVQKLRTEIVSTDDALDRAFLLDKFEAAVGEQVAKAIERDAQGSDIPCALAYSRCERIAREVTGGGSDE